MSRSSKWPLAGAALLALVFMGWFVAEVVQRRGKVAAACRRAQPLVERRTTRLDTLQELGAPWGDYGASDLPRLERLFASPPQEAETLRHRLRGENRVLIYSTNDYIMFVHFDGTDRAVHAECFHQ